MTNRREEIARLIDPTAFEAGDARIHRKTSLAKADAIIALFSPSEEEVERAARVALPGWWAGYDTRQLHGGGASWEATWQIVKDEILTNMRAALQSIFPAPEKAAASSVQEKE